MARDKTVERIKGQTTKNKEELRLRRVQQEVGAFENIKIRLGHPAGDFWHTIKEVNPNLILLGYDQKLNEQELKQRFPNITVERCSAYQPEFFKSSKF